MSKYNWPYPLDQIYFNLISKPVPQLDFPRKAYKQPKLQHLGNLHSITLGGSGLDPDSPYTTLGL